MKNLYIEFFKFVYSTFSPVDLNQNQVTSHRSKRKRLTHNFDDFEIKLLFLFSKRLVNLLLYYLFGIHICLSRMNIMDIYNHITFSAINHLQKFLYEFSLSHLFEKLMFVVYSTYPC